MDTNLECQGNTVQAFQQSNIYKGEIDMQPPMAKSTNKEINDQLATLLQYN